MESFFLFKVNLIMFHSFISYLVNLVCLDYQRAEAHQPHNTMIMCDSELLHLKPGVLFPHVHRLKSKCSSYYGELSKVSAQTSSKDCHHQSFMWALIIVSFFISCSLSMLFWLTLCIYMELFTLPLLMKDFYHPVHVLLSL